MNPPSQPAPQTRAFQSWQLVFIAVMLLVTVTCGLYIATVQAESHGAITGLTLTSDAPGTLTVSWDAASPTPTDYRVDWAKSDEDYQSWKVDDGHVYPAPTATAATIADLEHDTEYKIRMRARYYRGEHEGKSWGGPWATETITVAGEPVELPTPTPEPVKKDSAKKGSGNQRPTRHDPPQEDTTSVEGTLVSNLGQTIANTDNIVGPLDGINDEGAISFTTGDSAFGYHMTSVQLYMERYDESDIATVQVSIRGDNAGVPGGTTLHTLTTSAALTSNFQLITFTTPDEVRLQPTTVYWLQVSATGNRVAIRATASVGEDSQDDWRIGDRAASREDEGAWNTASIYNIFQIKILGHEGAPITESVSEPAGEDASANIYTAGRLALDGTVTGRHTAYDVDWFAFSAEARTKYQFTANPGEKGLPYYTLRILNDDGAEQRNSLITAGSDGAYHGSDRRNVLPFQTDTSGTYFVSIEPRGSSTAAYTLAMLGDDYPDSSLTPAIMDVSNNGRTFGDFHNYLMRTDANPDSSRTADIDWIRVDLQGNTTYEITYDVACLHEGEIVGIYDSDGHPTYHTGAAFDSSKKVRWCGDIKTKFTAPSDGWYFIGVTARGANFPHRDTNGLHLNKHWNPFTGVHGTLTITDITPNYPATGNPLVQGERRVGSTLKGDTAGVADDNGLTNPMLEYQWQRVEDGIQTDIPGAVSNTYRLTDDDEGKRIRLQVRFDDDYGYHEIRSGPATSYIVPEASRILVTNFNQGNYILHAVTNISNGFVSGAHPNGYTIDRIVAFRAFNTPASSNDAEFRLYTSTPDSDARERKPDTRIMTISGPNRIVTSNIWFNARSRVKLDPSTTYHTVLTTPTDETIGCSTAAGGGEDSNSLEGFDILDRHYVYPDSDTGFTDDQSCVIQIKGFELASSNLVQTVEFTSSPTQPDMYTTGELIEATATLTQAIAFDGPPPVILLQIGDKERRMEYVTSDSTDTSWIFRYTVVTDDRDDDGVSIKHNALRGYAGADLSHYGITNDQTSHVNAAPRVVSQRVSSSPLANLRYGPGEKIQFTMEFSLPVTVVGNPRLEFDIDTPAPQNEFASYLSGSGTKELVFSYTVQEVDDDSNGIEWGANSLRVVDDVDEINGVYNGLDAILDHTALNQLPDHLITQNPRVVSQEVTSDPTRGTDSDTYGAGDTITFETVFNQAVTVDGSPRLRFNIDSGTGYEYADYVSGSGTTRLIFSYTVLADDADTDGIYLYDNPLDYPNTAIDTIIGTSNNLPAVNSRIGNEGRLPGHKVDGSLTN